MQRNEEEIKVVEEPKVKATEKQASKFLKENYSEYQFGAFLLDGINRIVADQFFDVGPVQNLQRDSKVGIFDEDEIYPYVLKLLQTVKHSDENVFIVFRGVNWNIGIVYQHDTDSITIFDTTGFPNHLKQLAKNKELEKDNLEKNAMRKIINDLLFDQLDSASSELQEKSKAKNKSNKGSMVATFPFPTRGIQKFAEILSKEIIAASNATDKNDDFKFAFETQTLARKNVSAFKALDNDALFKSVADSDKKTMRGVTVNHLLARSKGQIDFAHEDWNKKDKYGYTPTDVAIEHEKIAANDLIDKALTTKQFASILVDIILKTEQSQFFKNHVTNKMRALLADKKLPLDSILENAAKRGAVEVLDFLSGLDINKKIIADFPNQQETKTKLDKQAIASIALQHGHADFFINLATKIGIGELNPAQGGGKKTLYDHAGKIQNSKKRNEVITLLNENLLAQLSLGKIPSDDYEKLVKHKEEVFELMKDKKKLLEKSLDFHHPSTLYEFFSVQRGVRETSEERGVLKKIFLQKLLHDLNDESIVGEKMKENAKYKKDIFKLIENDFSLLTKAARQPHTLLYQYFHPREKEKFFEKSLPNAIDKAYKKLEKSAKKQQMKVEKERQKEKEKKEKKEKKELERPLQIVKIR